MVAGLRKSFMGRKIIVNLFTKHGYRTSPGVSAKAAAIGECARGKSLEERKKCFKTHKDVKNASDPKTKSGRAPNKNK